MVAWCPDGWKRYSFPHLDHAHVFYVIDHGPAGKPSPSVMLMHEFPGISTRLFPLTEALAGHFRVVIPSILGRDGDPKYGDSLKQICVRREVHVLARHGVSAAVGWLRDIADEHVARRSNAPYGVIGMCFSGNFALALAIDPPCHGGSRGPAGHTSLALRARTVSGGPKNTAKSH